MHLFDYCWRNILAVVALYPGEIETGSREALPHTLQSRNGFYLHVTVDHKIHLTDS